MIMNDISNTTTLDTPYPFIPMYPQWTATGELLRQRTHRSGPHSQTSCFRQYALLTGELVSVSRNDSTVK